MSRPRTARCGTPSGWSRHKRDAEKPCDACALAKKDYDRRLRAASDNTLKNRAHARAQSLAKSELARRHHGEYVELYAKFKAEVFAERGLS